MGLIGGGFLRGLGGNEEGEGGQVRDVVRRALPSLVMPPPWGYDF